MSSAEAPSNNNSNEGSGASPSPGKGGKFLELMQKRIMAEQQQQQPPQPSGAEPNAATQNQSHQPSMGGSTDALQQQPQQQNPMVGAPTGVTDSSTAAQQSMSRPKGKDFATMSSRGPVPSALSQPQPPQMPIQPSQQQPLQQQISTSIPPSGKPKGKDFSAMASRMAVPAPASVAPLQSQPPMIPNPVVPSNQAAQVARAAQMQADARAAAGLPPLSKPTATSVTTSMSGMPSPRGNMPNQQLPHPQYPGMANMPQPHAPPTAPTPPLVPPHHSSQQQSQSYSRSSSLGYGSSGHMQSQPPLQQQHQHQPHYSNPNNPIYGNGMVPTQPDPMSRLPSTSTTASSVSSSNIPRGSRPAPLVTSPSAAPYRPSKTATTNTLASSNQREPTGRTPQPSSIESKVTMQASAVAISPAIEPYMAPLVGQRIQDLVSNLDPSYTIDSQAQEQLLQLADDFLDKVCKQSLRLATHRGSAVMEVQDVQLVLAKQWGIVIPGLGPPILNKARVAPIPSTSLHSVNSSKPTSGTKRRSSSSQKSSNASNTAQQKASKNSKQNESNHSTA